MEFEMNKSQVIEVPKDTVLEGVVVSVKKTTWREVIPAERIGKFKEPDDFLLVVKYETKYNGRHLKGEENIGFHENPMANSKLGKFLNKYEDLKAGVKVKIDYGSEGYPSIRLK